MLLFLSYLCDVRLMYSYSFFLSFCCFFVLICYLLFIFLVIQSDLEQHTKNLMTIYIVRMLIVKDYGKLGILYNEKLGGFILDKKERPTPPIMEGRPSVIH